MKAVQYREIIELPDVLFLQLLRFDYDANNNNISKNNQRFEFFEQLELSNYLPQADRKEYCYTLQCVLGMFFILF